MQQAVYTYRSESEKETDALAAALAAWLPAGAVLTLDGDLGAGKTRFSQGFARALGVTEVVNSPTFTIVKEYEGECLPFYHMDMYRISQEEADELGLDEYFYGSGVTLVEWASLIGDLLPPERLGIAIEIAGGSGRLFRLTPQGAVYERGCLTMKENGSLS